MNKKLDDERQYIDPATDRDVVPHGFRSTFKTWATEETNHQQNVIEVSLSHKFEGEAAAAYTRGDMAEKRTKLMQDWANYCAAKQKKGKVVSIQEAVA